MEYRSFGNSGLKTSRLAFGTWKNLGERITGRDAEILVHQVVESGITTFDTADVYGRSEETLGQILPAINRRDIVVITKCYWPMSAGVNDRGLSRKHIVESIDTSLSRLQLDYVDVLLCHRYDETVPLAEVLRTFDDLIRQGKILYWGTSEWPVTALIEAFELSKQYGWTPPIVEQGEYSLLHRRKMETELAPLSERHGLGLMAWSPLASGILAGRNLDDHIQKQSLLGQVSDGMRDKYHNPETLRAANKLKVLADETGFSMVELALKALLAFEPLDCVAMGISSIEQLNNNVSIFDGYLSEEVLDKVYSIFPPDSTLA